MLINTIVIEIVKDHKIVIVKDHKLSGAGTDMY
jgi:hypothetical protein